MLMNNYDRDLIALSSLLTRYRLNGGLPSVDGKPLDLNEYKSRLFAGTGIVPDTDVDVAIIQNNIINEDDDKNVDSTEPPSQQEPANTTPAPEEQIEQPPVNNNDTADKPTIGGKLFQFFNRDKPNESQ